LKIDCLQIMIIFRIVLIIFSISFVECQSWPQGYYMKLISMKCIPKEEFFVNVSCKTKPLGRYETLFTGNVYYVKIHKDMNVRSASNSGINFNLDFTSRFFSKCWRRNQTMSTICCILENISFVKHCMVHQYQKSFEMV
jgi:hypothetical protein